MIYRNNDLIKEAIPKLAGVHDYGKESCDEALLALRKVKAFMGYPIAEPFKAAEAVLERYAGEPVIVIRLSDAVKQGMIREIA